MHFILNPVNITILAGAAALLSCLATRVVRDYSIRRNILDIPNERSSHVIPIPRGGGVAFASVFLLIISAIALIGALPSNYCLALGGGGLVIMLTGWIDDRVNLSIIARLTAQAAAALWAMGWIWGREGLLTLCELDILGIIAFMVVFISIMWMINLFNFMDGIDGLAASEAIVVCASAGFIMIFQGYYEMGTVSIILAGSVAGFIIWNWPPARIFMGDAGSGFLGYIIAVLVLLSARSGFLPLETWMLLLVIFIVDATGTLITRIIRGQQWWQAHREHVYQKAVRSGCTHLQVTVFVIVFNLALTLFAGMITLSKTNIFPVTVAVYLVCIIGFAVLNRRFSMTGV